MAGMCLHAPQTVKGIVGVSILLRALFKQLHSENQYKQPYPALNHQHPVQFLS